MIDILVPEDRLRECATNALVAGGMRPDDAELTARVLVLADMFGIRTHGISRIPQYLDRVRLGGIDAQADVAVERVAPGLALVNGLNGIGPLVAMKGLEAALDGARQAGIGAAFVRGSNHFGPIIPYALMAAEKGYASIIGSNATTTIAPWGGRDTRVGNNPLGIGVPNPGGDPIILDMAMSVAARAKIRSLLKSGEQLPSGWAADSEGKPTTDPAAALAGFLLPFGGHKGYGLAVMVDLLAGLLSGAAFLTKVNAWDKDPGVAQDLGHFFILIDASKLGPASWLHSRMEEFRAIVRDTPAADPGAPVMTPGEREMRILAKSRQHGVAIAEIDYVSIGGRVAT
jgi:LDH2 family malate/lactate/ureidoglycolate dehydrogenase